jgi:hypothetical protein
VFPKHYGTPATFDTVFGQLNSWALSPSVLRRLLKRSVFGDLIDEVLASIRQIYTEYSEFESKRAFCFKLYHRQRFYVGGVVWHSSFGSWPILPAADSVVLDAAGGIPPAVLSDRRAQKDLLRRNLPALARIPVDTNSYYPELLEPTLRGMLSKYVSDRLRAGSRRLGLDALTGRQERRTHYRTYDFHGPGWTDIRREARRLRDVGAGLFNMDVLDELIPDVHHRVQFRDGIVDASGRKILLGFLLAAADRSAWVQGAWAPDARPAPAPGCSR